MLGIAALTLSALVLSYFGVKWLRRWAERHAILAIPNVRSSHDRPIPLGGGLAITAVTLSCFLVYSAFIRDWNWTALLAYFLGALVIAGISWLDDLRTLPITLRLIAHGIAALIAILGIGAWKTLSVPLLGSINIGWLGPLATFIWIVGLTNAYNFMDGIDGIAGSQAVIAGLGWAFLGWFGDQQFAGILGLLLASTSLGFLGHNWPPARIFMGDVGSAFLGYTLAVLAIIANPDEPRMAIAGMLLVWPFIFDTAFTFLRRLIKRENVLAAHRSHLYQRLIVLGHTHRAVTRLYILLALSGALLAIAWVQSEAVMVFLVLAALCLSLWMFVIIQEGQKESKS